MPPNITALERFALGNLQLRRRPDRLDVAPKDRRLAPIDINPAIPTEAYESALGALKAIARHTGETPVALCKRLGITGARRRYLIPPQGTDRWRLSADERRASYRTRDPLRNTSQREQAERRAAILGIALDSPEWDALMARERAFEARMRKMRDEAGPPHPMRARYYAKK